MIGTKLGQFEITAKLGEGGMGEVYRATDTKLKREVAIKVLPAAFTEDRERLARFEREAQLLAQLQHPNIASIFGLEESDGTRALVMELVEGPTLAERLEQGPFSFNESLAVALQIAHALEEAHEKGIVHRDLKPQNIKASIGGKVKVLDFGLAKAMDSAAGSGAAAELARSPTMLNSPTLTAAHGTQLGVILGTAAYMAPEQARGGAVDKRADIWAFGVVVYEMLTGRSLFAAETVSDTLAGVLKTEIDLARLPTATPPAIRRLLRRCLERNPKNRLHDIADARIVLDEVLSGRADLEGAAARTPAPVPRRLSGWSVAALAGVAVGSLVVAYVAGRLGSRGVPPQAVEIAQALPPELSLPLQELTEIAISPDGRFQALTVELEPGRTQLLLRDLSAAEPRLLPGTEGAHTPFFSPDGGSVGFFVGNELRRLPLGGGPSLSLAGTASVQATRGATWSRDGYVYFAPSTATGLMRVSENGGEAEPVTTLDTGRGERTHRWPAVLPDGGAVLFTCDTEATTEYYDDARIEAVRPATGERKVVLEGSSLARFLPPDRLIFARGGSLFAARFDPRRLELQSAPVAVAQSVASSISSGAVQMALAENGTLAWIPGGSQGSVRELIWIDPEGGERPVGLRRGIFAQVALSPDGRRAVLQESMPPDMSLWVSELERGTLSRLTFEGTAADPAWTPDGLRVAFAFSADGRRLPVLAWRRADGSSGAEDLLDLGAPVSAGSFTPDGRELVFERREPGRGQGVLWRLALDGGRETSPFAANEATSFHGEISPDGRWIAYTSLDSGLMEVFLRPYPSGGGKWQVSSGGGSEPHWAGDSRALYFRNSGAIYRIEIDFAGGLALAAPRRVGATIFSGTLGKTYSVAPDGRLLTLRYPPESQQVRRVNLALAWGDRVERLLTKRQ